MGKTVNEWVLADDEVDQHLKGHHNTLNDDELATLKELEVAGRVELRFNWIFFETGDSKIPENSGFFSSVVRLNHDYFSLYGSRISYWCDDCYLS